MKKRLAITISLVIIVIIVVSAFTAIVIYSASKPFYVGVTYGGDSVDEAKQLIDKVKGYTNLFVFTSSSLMNNLSATEQIGDYAVNAGLNVILYYGNIGPNTDNSHALVSLAQTRWNSSFLGLYFNDEPGGRMIDSTQVNLYPQDMNGSVTRDWDGAVTLRITYSTETNLNYTSPNGKTVVESVGVTRYNATGVSTTFHPSGVIDVYPTTYFGVAVNSTLTGNQTEIPVRSPTEITDISKMIYYYPNGTITCRVMYSTGLVTIDSGTYTYLPDGTVLDKNGALTTEGGSISQFTPYAGLLKSNPLGDYAETADTFLRIKEKGLDSVRTNQSDLNVFTSDYALYWFDYQIGYDTVLAQFVGNESRDRHIALCRGAAETLGKDWGAIVTWKYNQPPYLESGDELYSDLALAYSAGAKYGIVFTYPNVTAYGTLTEEHFTAMQRFWNTLKNDPDSFGSKPSQVAYVVPADYGFSFRNANDKIWGLFSADEQAQKIYSDTVFLTDKYGANLNILYDGPQTKAKLGSYSTVYYYNQTIT
jgi:hypothetical protein